MVFKTGVSSIYAKHDFLLFSGKKYELEMFLCAFIIPLGWQMFGISIRTNSNVISLLVWWFVVVVALCWFGRLHIRRVPRRLPRATIKANPTFVASIKHNRMFFWLSIGRLCWRAIDSWWRWGHINRKTDFISVLCFFLDLYEGSYMKMAPMWKDRWTSDSDMIREH